jgi:energy-coupling factor transporter ATP-binding protein EcfA2
MSNDSSIISLDVRKLDYRYPSGQQALSDISFSIAPGERVGVVGPSGAGKSTLLMHFNGLLPEESSAARSAEQNVSVHVDGLPMLHANLREIRSRVGFLFQDPDDQLFCPTVREDVAFGPLNQGVSKTEVEERISESLSAVGLTGYADRSTLQLSVGERKRVCLAGVLACRPSLLALDEPSSNLDPRARRGLLEILSAFPGSQIIATHDLDLVVAHCQRVLVLDEGQIHGDGPPHVVLSDEILMERHGLEVPLRLRFDVGGTS